MGGVCRSETAAVRLCLLVQLFCLLARYVNCTALRLQWVTDVGSPVVGTPVIAPHGLVHVPTTSSGLHTLSGRTGSIVESSNAAVGMLAASPIRARVRVDAHPIEPTLGPAASNARHTRVVMLQLGYSGAIVESSAPLPPSMASQDRSYGIRYTDAFHDQSHGHLFADAQVVARVPRLRVRTDWHSGLQFDHEVDHSNADVSKNMTSADIAESIDELSAAGINVCVPWYLTAHALHSSTLVFFSSLILMDCNFTGSIRFCAGRVPRKRSAKPNSSLYLGKKGRRRQ